MKTLNELYNEVITSEELMKELESLNSKEEIAAFVKKHGCDATLDEIEAFWAEKVNSFGELSEEDLEQVAGGAYGEKFVTVVGKLYKIGKKIWDLLRKN